MEMYSATAEHNECVCRICSLEFIHEINKETVATVDNVHFLDDLRAKLRSKLENILRSFFSTR